MDKICKACKYRHTCIKAGAMNMSSIKNLLKASYEKKPPEKIDNYDLDRDLSTKTSKVYYDKQTKQPIVLHQGTSGISDWMNNAIYAIGGEKAYKRTTRYKEAEAVQKKAEAKYGTELLETLGHSQAGLQAELLGKNGKNIITYNKATIPFSNSKKDNQTDIRTKNDIVSALNPFSFLNKKKGKEITIPSEGYSIIKEHSPDALDRVDKDMIVGNGISNKSPIIQSVLIEKNKNTLEEAKKWILSHGLKIKKIDTTDKYYRFRQHTPATLKKQGYTKYAHKLIDKNKNISFIILY